MNITFWIGVALVCAGIAAWCFRKSCGQFRTGACIASGGLVGFGLQTVAKGLAGL